MKKIKTKILTLSTFLLIIFNINIVYAFDTDNPILLPDSTSTSIVNSYSRKVTTVIYLENRAVNITNITPSNGKLVSYKFDKNTKKLEITVDNGYSNFIPNPTKYSKYVTKTLDSTSTYFGSSTYYSSGDYSGTIYKSGSYYKNYNLSTSSTSKSISGYNSTSASFKIYKNDSNDSPSSQSVMESNAKSEIMSSKGWSYSDYVNYNSGGYSGKLTADITAKATFMVSVTEYPQLADGKHRGTISVTKSYSGTVTKPGTDWYSQDYSGTVYAPGEDEVYSYNIKINYEKTPLAPNAPQILTPPQTDNLYFLTEAINLNWSYSDPEGMPLIASRITLTNVLTGEKYNYDIENNKTLHFLPAIFPQGAYNLTISVKNNKNMISTSKPILIRRNVYRKPGNIATETISSTNSFRKIKIVTTHELESKFVNGKKISTSITGYILLPKSSSNNQYTYDYTTTDPNYRIKFTLEDNFDYSNIIVLPRETTQMKILFILDSEDNEFSEITPSLDNVTVYAR